MTKRKQRPLGPAWLADWVVALGSWKLASLIGAGYWLWRHWRGVGAVLLAALVFVQTGSLAVAGAALVVVFAASRWRPAKRAARWWDHDTLSSALVDAGVLKMQGEKLPTLSYQGKVVHSEHGDTVTVGLPQARGLEDVVPRRLAQALRVPVARLSLTQDEDDPANTIRVHIGVAAAKSAPAEVASAARTDWRKPVRIGVDDHGQALELATVEANTLIAGIPGSGKTSLARVVLAHYLLDPVSSVYLVDGKGSRRDYASCLPLCTRYVSGTTEHAVAGTAAVLDEVLAIVQARNDVDEESPGVLLLLEEYQDIRSGASREQREYLDETVGRIVRMGRAVDVQVVFSTQKPSGQDMATGTRDLIRQRVCLQVRNAAAAALVLGGAPPFSLPKRVAQAIYADPAEFRKVTLDYLSPKDWAKICGRAAALRTPVRPQLTLAPLPQPAGEGLVDEVLGLLATEGQLSATDLHRRLSPETREAVGDERALGVELSRHRGLVTRGHDKRGRVWRLTDSGVSARGVDA